MGKPTTKMGNNLPKVTASKKSWRVSPDPRDKTLRTTYRKLKSEGPTQLSFFCYLFSYCLSNSPDAEVLKKYRREHFSCYFKIKTMGKLVQEVDKNKLNVSWVKTFLTPGFILLSALLFLCYMLQFLLKKNLYHWDYFPRKLNDKGSLITCSENPVSENKDSHSVSRTNSASLPPHWKLNCWGPRSKVWENFLDNDPTSWHTLAYYKKISKALMWLTFSKTFTELFSTIMELSDLAWRQIKHS